MSGRDRLPSARKDPNANLVTIASYWSGWGCLFPQHGPGRKHHRKIALEPWRQFIVGALPQPNRSQDIKDLFCWACDLVGVDWRPWARHHISVARRDSVAKLDEFIGLKA